MTPPSWVKSNLAAIGSAAVLSVYAAGYVKTKPAADRFANESDDRRRATTPIQPVSNEPIASVPTPTAPAKPAPKSAPKSALKQTPKSALKQTPKSALKQTPKKTAKPVTTVPASAPKVSEAAAPATTPAAPAAPVQSAPAPVPSQTPTAATADTTQPQKEQKEQAGYKDGIYYGWGSSRHGDIQAAVEVKSGRILSAVITQCLTQYSCSWISPLPPQVVQRQSAEVDYVSGATQSANAFYYAVVQALKQAR